MRVISLIGFMGAGKSTIGRALGIELDLPFSDLDNIIEKKSGYSIPVIFDKFGESYFRKAESDALQEYISSTPAGVLATGGGVVIEEKNRYMLREQTLCLFLDPPFEILCERVGKCIETRPLALEGPEKLIDRFRLRKPMYLETAQMVINSPLDSDAIVKAIVEKINKTERDS